MPGGKTATVTKNVPTLSVSELQEQPNSGIVLWKPFRSSAYQ